VAALVLLLLATALGAHLLGGRGLPEEREEIRPEAAAEDVALWQGEWERRAAPWQAFPDPPGRGEVHRERYWISHAVYDMELRRRGDRVTLGIGGVDRQVMGGGWIAFGEGRVEGPGRPGRPFAGTRVFLTWGCLGIRYRHASDGAARLVFTPDGEGLEAHYMAHEAPDYWAKAEGRRAAGPKPPYGGLRGQIPVSGRIARLDDGEYAVRMRVRSRAGAAIEGAIVQVKGRSATRVLTGREGTAVVRFPGGSAPVAQVLCAAAPGHRISEEVFFAGEERPGWRAGAEALHDVVVVLDPEQREDDPDYAWNRAAGDLDPDDAMACGTCHQWHYEEWSRSRHAASASSGHVEHVRRLALAGAPGTPDDCRGCHQPGSAAQEPGGGWQARGPLAGNHCDFCHKVRAVTDLRESGVFGALVLARPPAHLSDRPGGIHQVQGNLPDATFAYMGAVYNPLFSSSHLCAACHQGGGRWREGHAPKVDTFEEWRAWAAALPQGPVQACQDCHMPGGHTITEDGTRVDQAAWDAIHRSPEEIHSHRFLGSEPHFAREALRLEVVPEPAGPGATRVAVSLRNVGAGHRVPTGTWSKHVVVGVWARQGDVPLGLEEGGRAWLVAETETAEAPRVGDWRNPAGFVLGVFRAGDPEGRSGTAAWWEGRSREDVLDRRLAPGETREAAFTFRHAEGETAPVEVEVWVVHRRGALGRGLHELPWTLGPYEASPETLWMRAVR
jgi:hypothetical protein